MFVRIVKNILLQVLILSITLLVSELICRAYLIIKFDSPRSMYNNFGYDREPLLGFEMIPNVRDKFLPGIKTTYSTNSKGFRGKEEFGRKKEDEVRIALFGGSAVFGFGASSDETTIASYLKKDLEARFPARKFSVINAGNPGYVSYQVLAKLQHRVLELKPDIAVFYMGWNDLFFSSFNQPFERNSFYGNYQYFNMDSWQHFINYENRNISYDLAKPFALTLVAYKAYQHIKDMVVEKPVSKELCLSDNQKDNIQSQFYDNLSSIAAISQYRKMNTIIVTLFSDHDLHPKERNNMNTLIKKVARESGARLIDADSIVMSDNIKGINNERDMYHLTDKGNEFLADLLAAEISDVISGQNIFR